MRKQIISRNPEFYYFRSGNDPHLLLHSGTHGDEYEVIDLVFWALKKYEKLLPPFIFVPMVSPSAVVKKTRENSSGSDINRIFKDNSEEREIILNQQVLLGKKANMFVSFHEDPECFEYYIYDVGYDAEESKIIKNHNMLLKSRGIKLLNGIDDSSDPNLGFKFNQGYKKFIFQENEDDNGMITNWVLRRQIASQFLIPEIPGKINKKQKNLIVETFFTEILLKSFN